MAKYMVTLGAGTGSGTVIQCSNTTATLNGKPLTTATGIASQGYGNRYYELSRKLLILFLAAVLLSACSSCSIKIPKLEASSVATAGPAANKEPSLEDLKAMGVNTDHFFNFTDTCMTYNGKVFNIGKTIDEMQEIFGNYSRLIELESGGLLWIWDDIGLRMTTHPFDDPNLKQINNIYLRWNLEIDTYETSNTSAIERRIRMREQNAHNYFKGNVLVDGVPLGRGMNIKPFLKQLSEKQSTLKFSNDPFPALYRDFLPKYDYTKIDIPRNRIMVMVIRVSENHSDIELIEISTFSRNSRDIY